MASSAGRHFVAAFACNIGSIVTIAMTDATSTLNEAIVPDFLKRIFMFLLLALHIFSSYLV